MLVYASVSYYSHISYCGVMRAYNHQGYELVTRSLPSVCRSLLLADRLLTICWRHTGEDEVVGHRPDILRMHIGICLVECGLG